MDLLFPNYLLSQSKEKDPVKSAIIEEILMDLKKSPSLYKGIQNISILDSSIGLWNKKENKWNLPDNDTVLKRVIAKYLFGSREIIFADTGWQRQRWLDWNCCPWPDTNCWKYRDCTIKLICKLSHPDLDKIWGDIEGCAKTAAVVASIVCLWTLDPSCISTFKDSFFSCLELKGIGWAREITVEIVKEERCNPDQCE